MCEFQKMLVWFLILMKLFFFEMLDFLFIFSWPSNKFNTELLLEFLTKKNNKKESLFYLFKIFFIFLFIFLLSLQQHPNIRLLHSFSTRSLVSNRTSNSRGGSDIIFGFTSRNHCWLLAIHHWGEHK